MGNVYVEMLMWGLPPSSVPSSEARLVLAGEHGHSRSSISEPATILGRVQSARLVRLVIKQLVTPNGAFFIAPPKEC